MCYHTRRTVASRSVVLDPPPDAARAMARALGLAADEAGLAHVDAWLRELCTWNRTHDLTAARTTAELLDLMVADAVVLARHLPHGLAVVDVGSGAGAPGLPLALLRPDLRVTLIEPLQKRVSFMRLVLSQLGRLDVTVVAGRGEAQPEGTFDVALSRATLAPEEWIALGRRLVREGGQVVAFLATAETPAGDRLSLESEVPYAWPETGAERRLAIYRAN